MITKFKIFILPFERACGVFPAGDRAASSVTCYVTAATILFS